MHQDMEPFKTLSQSRDIAKAQEGPYLVLILCDRLKAGRRLKAGCSLRGSCRCGCLCRGCKCSTRPHLDGDIGRGGDHLRLQETHHRMS